MAGGNLVINVAQAALKTASVQIKTLTVNNKQMTLAVFRQLFEESVIDPRALTLNGQVWGQVNYHWSGCFCSETAREEHIHVVWQKGSELRRSMVSNFCPDPEDLTGQARVLKRHAISASVAGLLLDAMDEPPVIDGDFYKTANWRLHKDTAERLYYVREWFVFSLDWVTRKDSQRRKEAIDDVRRCVGELRRSRVAFLLNGLTDEMPIPSEEYKSAIQNAYRLLLSASDKFKADWTQRRQQYQSLYASLWSSDHLFIAV